MYSISRKRCLVQRGASYQYSPETRSSFPSRLMSAKTAVSEAPRSMVCFSKGISSGRLAERPVAQRNNRAHEANVEYRLRNMYDRSFRQQQFMQLTLLAQCSGILDSGK